jgi:two-component system, LuxR family, sensor kinase FixL
LELVSPSLERSAIRTELAVQANLPDVAVDLSQIQQVVTNLVRNAVEALTEGGVASPHLVVSARSASAGYVEIAVSDNGPGFPPGFDLSEPNLVSTKSDGLGIGLQLCRSIVEAHGGQMMIEHPRQGARVRFTVPIATGAHHG